MSNVIDLFSKRSSNLTIDKLAEQCYLEIFEAWEQFEPNRLNDFFVSFLPSWAQKEINYISNLNSIAELEAQLELTIVVYSPGTLSIIGWVAAFLINDVKIHTPAMEHEHHARCFNILVFLKLSHELVKHGLIT